MPTNNLIQLLGAFIAYASAIFVLVKLIQAFFDAQVKKKELESNKTIEVSKISFLCNGDIENFRIINKSRNYRS